MLVPDAGDLYHSSYNLRRSGLTGCGCDMAGPAEIEAAKIAAINAGSAVLASDGDITAAFGPSLDGLAALSLALPPPWSFIASASASAANDAVKAIRNYLKRAVLCAGRYLPVDIATKVIKTLEGGWGTSWTYAGKDKLVRAIMSPDDGWPDALTGAAKAGNATLAKSEQLDLDNCTRFVHYVYKVCTDKGAKDWQAACVALGVFNFFFYKNADNPSSWYGGLPQGANGWAYGNQLKAIIGIKPGETLQQAYTRRATEAGLIKVDSDTLKKAKPKGGASGEGGPGLLIGAGLLALLALRK